MTAALWFIVSTYMISEILEREWQTTAQFVRGEVKEFLVPEDFKTKDRKSVGHKFEQLLKHILVVPDLVRFKVYNPQKVVIWAHDKRLVGKSFPDNRELQQAIDGKVVADLSSAKKREDLAEQENMQDVIHLYVPIYAENPRELLGVLETYKKADPVYQAIHKARIVVLVGALGGGLLLYLSLLVIVRQASRKIEEQQDDLLKMQSELIGSQRMAAVGEMAAAVAHSIGNPLSAIRAAAQVAMLQCESGDSREPAGRAMESLQSIIQQVDRVKKRMQGLLNFSKPLAPQRTPVEINSLLREVMETLRPRFDEARVTSNLELESSIPKTSLDTNLIEQALIGIITNALEATPNGGKVTIRTKTIANGGHGSNVNVSIEDTGEGIPTENRDQVFTPFFTTKPHGTGMGLALAKKFVEKNGGTISIEGGSTGGTRINLIFPASAEN